MLTIFVINCLLVSITIVIHYEMLLLLSKLIPSLTFKPRLRVVIGVYGTILAHVIEVWIFGIAFYLQQTLLD